MQLWAEWAPHTNIHFHFIAEKALVVWFFFFWKLKVKFYPPPHHHHQTWKPLWRARKHTEEGCVCVCMLVLYTSAVRFGVGSCVSRGCLLLLCFVVFFLPSSSSWLLCRSWEWERERASPPVLLLSYTHTHTCTHAQPSAAGANRRHQTRPTDRWGWLLESFALSFSFPHTHILLEGVGNDVEEAWVLEKKTRVGSRRAPIETDT